MIMRNIARIVGATLTGLLLACAAKAQWTDPPPTNSGGGWYTPPGNITNIGGGEADPIASSNLTAHINDASAAHPASAISATGTYSTVQEAINSMDSYLTSLRYTTISTNGNYTITTNDVGKLIVLTGSTDKIFYLPSVSSADVGLHFVCVNTCTSSGRLTIDAADSDTIADSGAGDTIYNDNSEPYATISLVLATATQWVITGAHGTWVTTD